MDFYSSTARLLDIILASPRPMLLRPLCAKQGPRSFALLAETLKYIQVLDKLITSVDLLKSEAEVLQSKPMPSSRALAMLLVHDFLFAQKGIALPKGHKVRQAIERYESRWVISYSHQRCRTCLTDSALRPYLLIASKVAYNKQRSKPK